MYQRDKRLSDTSVNSPYFQPVAGGSPASSPTSSPYPPVNYGVGVGGYDVPTVPTSYTATSSYSNNPVHNPYQPTVGPSKSMTIGAIFIWTIIIMGSMYGYYEYSHLPKLHEKHNKHIHEIMQKHASTTKENTPASAAADITKLKKELENERIRYSKVKQDYDQEHKNAIDWKDRSTTLERSLSNMKHHVQESSRHKLLLKYVTL